MLDSRHKGRPVWLDRVRGDQGGQGDCQEPGDQGGRVDYRAVGSHKGHVSRGELGLTRDFQQNQRLQEGEVLSGQEVGTAPVRRQWGLRVWKVDKVVLCPQQWLFRPNSLHALPSKVLTLALGEPEPAEPSREANGPEASLAPDGGWGEVHLDGAHRHLRLVTVRGAPRAWAHAPPHLHTGPT